MIHQKYHIQIVSNDSALVKLTDRALNGSPTRVYTVEIKDLTSFLSDSQNHDIADVYIFDLRDQTAEQNEKIRTWSLEKKLASLYLLPTNESSVKITDLYLHIDFFALPQLLEKSILLCLEKQKFERSLEQAKLTSTSNELAVLKHDLSTPLTVMIFHCEKILKLISNSPLTQFRVLGIAKTIEKILNLALKIKRIMNVESGRFSSQNTKITTLKCSTLLEQALEQCEDKIHYTKIVPRINNADDPTLLLHEHDFLQVIINLIRVCLDSAQKQKASEKIKLTINVIKSSVHIKFYFELSNQTPIVISDETNKSCQNICSSNDWRYEIIANNPNRVLFEVPEKPVHLEKGKKVLVLEDHPEIGKRLQNFFQSQHTDCIWVQHGEHAKELLEKEPIGLMISDLDLPDMDSSVLTDQIKNICPVVFITGFENLDLKNNKDFVTSRLLYKPFTTNELLRMINKSRRGL